MFSFTHLLICSFIVLSVSSEEVCYGDLGCFSSDAPYDSFWHFPPRSPAYIGTRFLLYTQHNPTDFWEVDRTQAASLLLSNFNPLLKTVFLIHGYTSSGTKSNWVQTAKDKLIKRRNVNVFVIDWGRGAKDIYTKSVQNTRVVGREVGMFIQFLQKESGALYVMMHLVGHSLGAHISGFAGETTPGIGRITGLDPAGPGFRNTDPICRLDPSDALLVDNIHTDGETLLVVGFGMLDAIGHMDFYPNGGKEQPGCPPTVFDMFANMSEVSCSHSRATEFFIESIEEEDCFSAFPCLNNRRFESGKCTSCGLLGCPKMGYFADVSQVSGTFYLRTSGKQPFCWLKDLIKQLKSAE
ncbi:pancreatic triacylglycerol lipase-like [Antedon mediterranea]|uniref:pancreatic triacylglycerol lipase-like n=1 Tax=Antedon mediterranea TaxID=105859 RepID=UPI003AF4D841